MKQKKILRSANKMNNSKIHEHAIQYSEIQNYLRKFKNLTRAFLE